MLSQSDLSWVALVITILQLFTSIVQYSTALPVDYPAIATGHCHGLAAICDGVRQFAPAPVGNGLGAQSTQSFAPRPTGRSQAQL
jgi:hypothetical protein